MAMILRLGPNMRGEVGGDREAVSGGGERSQVVGSGLRWRGAIAGGERSQMQEAIAGEG